MRVAYITHYTALYGANRSLLDLVQDLRARHGVLPFVVVPAPGDLVDVLSGLGIDHAVVPFAPWMSERYYSGRWYHRVVQHIRQVRAARDRRRTNERIAPQLIRNLRERSIDLVHVNSAAVGITPQVVRDVDVPVLWHVREMPELHYRVHFDQGGSYYGRTLRKASRLIAISRAVEQDIRRYAGQGARVIRIHDGVLSHARFAELARERRDTRVTGRPFTFLLMGLIHPSKGHAEAVEAVHELRSRGLDVRVLIVGTGRDRELRRQIAALGLQEHISMRGFTHDPLAVLREVDALLMCSRNEALGRVTIEAMAAGTPVIGHDSGGTSEVIGHERTGLLYAGGSTALADAMVRLMNDVDLRVSMADQALMEARVRFSIEACGDAVMGVYRSVLHQGHRTEGP